MATSTGRVPGLTLAVAALVCLVAATVPAQSRIKYAAAKRISSVQGADVYAAYCASCHGSAGLGNGPAADLLEERPPDLTLIVVRDGEFNQVHVMHHIGTAPGEGDPQMPNWPRILTSVYRSPAAAYLATRNLALRIESMQRQ